LPATASPHREMFRYNAVLFDMDGTLLDSVEDITYALALALEAHHYPPYDKAAVTTFIGNGSKQLIRRALPKYTDSATVDAVLADFKRHYQERCDHFTQPYPGIISMLAALDEAGMRLAIVSNKTDSRVKQLTRAYFGSLIHVAVGSRTGVPLKPAPDMLALAMRELGVDPAHTLYIGDSQTDFEAASNAGIGVILAQWGYGNPNAMSLLSPLFFTNDPAELPMLILQEQEDAP